MDARQGEEAFRVRPQQWPHDGVAGLWDAWKDPANGQRLQTFTIATTDANEIMMPVHNRMPVILHESDFNRWLSREETHQPPVDLLLPFPSEEMEAPSLPPWP